MYGQQTEQIPSRVNYFVAKRSYSFDHWGVYFGCMGAGASSTEASFKQNDPGKVTQLEAQRNEPNPAAELKTFRDEAKIASLSSGKNKSTAKVLVEEDPVELKKGTKSQAQIDAG